MRTARSSGFPGGLHQAPPGAGTPWEQTPTSWEQAPLVNRMTDACENITLPQLHCGR